MKLLNKILTGIIGVAIGVLIATFPTMWLWNWIMPIIFELPKINFFETIGILLLTTVLFKPTD